MRLVLTCLLVLALAAPVAASPTIVRIIVFCPGTMSPVCPDPAWGTLAIYAAVLSLLFPNPPVAPYQTMFTPAYCAEHELVCFAARAQGIL